MALLEQEAIRFAESLDDYEHISLVGINSEGPNGHSVIVHDERFDVDYEIASHCDYWGVVGAIVGCSVAFGCLVAKRVETETNLKVCVRNFFRSYRESRDDIDRTTAEGLHETADMPGENSYFAHISADDLSVWVCGVCSCEGCDWTGELVAEDSEALAELTRHLRAEHGVFARVATKAVA